MRPTLEALVNCPHPLDLINDQRRDMARRHELEPNALLIGRNSRMALKNRRDAAQLFNLGAPRAPGQPEKFYGYTIVWTETVDQFEFAYLPGLEAPR